MPLFLYRLKPVGPSFQKL